MIKMVEGNEKKKVRRKRKKLEKKLKVEKFVKKMGKDERK